MSVVSVVFVLQHVTDRGVHQPDVADVGGARARVVEATLGHHVEHELAGLEEPSLRVGHELCRALEHHGVPGPGVAGRDRGHPQGEAELGKVLGEQVLAALDQLGLGPRGQWWTFLDELAERLRRFVAARRDGDHPIHQIGRRCVELVVEVRPDHRVGVGIAVLPEPVEERTREHGRADRCGHGSPRRAVMMA